MAIERRQLESAEASSMTVISRLASGPLPWVPWLNGKSVQLVIKRFRVQFSADLFVGFLSLSPKLNIK